MHRDEAELHGAGITDVDELGARFNALRDISCDQLSASLKPTIVKLLVEYVDRCTVVRPGSACGPALPAEGGRTLGQAGFTTEGLHLRW
jgi:hypothetical protein